MFYLKKNSWGPPLYSVVFLSPQVPFRWEAASVALSSSRLKSPGGGGRLCNLFLLDRSSCTPRSAPSAASVDKNKTGLACTRLIYSTILISHTKLY